MWMDVLFPEGELTPYYNYHRRFIIFPVSIIDMKEKKIDYRTAILVFLTITCLLVLLLLNRNRSYYKSVKQVPIEVGLPAPDFTFPGINGKMVACLTTEAK
jgi:hypothetical protein